MTEASLAHTEGLRNQDLRAILPDTARIKPSGQLTVGGCDLAELAESYGTPLYVYDEATLLARARGFRDGLRASYPGPSSVHYASKAYCAPWLLRLLRTESLSLDVVSGGELFAARQADFPAEQISFHGNNKGEAELAEALDAGVGRIIVDNLDEVERLGRLAADRQRTQAVLLRVAPGVEAHTHEHIKTGMLDTKFGLSLQTGAAEEGVRRIAAQPRLRLIGLHAHIGSQIFELEPYAETVERLFAFARRMDDVVEGFGLHELSPGGGFGIRYTSADDPHGVAETMRLLGEIVAEKARQYGYHPEALQLAIEPGRSIVGPAAVALYRVGSVKEIPGVRTYVAMDGGMADNIRPTAYGAAYTALLANRAADEPDGEYAVAGRYCESGDVLIRAVRLPHPRVDDLLAVPSSGAYHLSMASNYNLAPRPAVVAVRDGQARLVTRRETYADLLQREL